MTRRRPPIDWETQTLRSLLFAPGNHARRLEKLGSFGSDAIVLDLEDAVANAEKVAARATTKAAIPSYEGTVVIVRVNGAQTGLLEDDLQAIVCPELDCVLVPKVERPETVAGVDRALAHLEDERGITPGAIRLLPIVETAAGLVRCEQIAAAATERVVTLVFGLGDFSVDIRVDLTREGTELLYARSRVVVAARAASMPSPIDGPYPDIQDFEGLYENTLLSRRLGFQGRVAVYPAQVDPIQRAYSELTPDELEQFSRVVAAFEEAEAAGLASIQVDGRFVDYPFYYRARQRLRFHEALVQAAPGAKECP